MHADFAGKSAILLDLDDTLYAYAPCNDAALVALHAELSRRVAIDFAGFRRLHDAARTDLAQRLRGSAASHNRLLFCKEIVAALGGPADPAWILDLHEAYWRAFLAAMVVPPGFLEVLEQLAQRYALALVTNQVTSVQLAKLRALGYARFFAAITTSEEVGADKPDRRMFDTALERLGVPAVRAVMLGDDPRGDIGGARAAGLTTIRTVEFRPAKDGEAEADFTIARLAEVLDLLS